MTQQDLELLLNVAMKAATVGSDILKNYARQNLSSSLKGDINNFVTEADLASETAVRNAIRELRPTDEISGEEYETETNHEAKVRWSIDPLDGTINFMRGLPFFATSVGAQNIETKEWLVGVVIAPELNTMWFATKGGGAFVEHNGQRKQIFGPPQRESKIVATGFSYSPEVRAQQFKELQELMPQFQDLRRNGAAAIDVCHVAEGVLDAYFERDTKEHDWAAAALIAEEAGVKVKRPEFVGDLCTAGF